MLVLLPVSILTLTLLALLLSTRSRKAVGIAWLISILAVFITLVICLFQLFHHPAPFSLSEWYLGKDASASLVFQFDQNSGPYVLALISLLLAVLMVAASQYSYADNLWPWVGSLFITIGGLFAVLAATPLALIFAWTIIDSFELLIILQTIENQRQRRGGVISLAARLAGIFMIIWAVLDSRGRGQGLTLTSFPPEDGIFLLLAAGFRLGVIPMHLPYAEESGLRRELGTVIRLVGPATSLVLLSRLPPTVVPPTWAPLLLLFTTLAAVYGSIMWLASRDVLNGRPYLIIAIAGLAVGSAIRGRPMAALTWGTTLLFSGGFIFLYNFRSRSLLAAALLTWIGLTGLPFTPAASGWQGLVVIPFNLLDIVTILAHSTLLIGFMRHYLKPGPTLQGMEGWARVMYALGLFNLVLTQWLVGIIGWKGSFTVGNWWASSASILIFSGVFAFFWISERRSRQRLDFAGGWFVPLLRKTGPAIIRFINLNWLYRLISWLFSLIQKLVNFLTLILEGEGGILWALVLLVLIVSFILPGGAP